MRALGQSRVERLGAHVEHGKVWAVPPLKGRAKPSGNRVRRWRTRSPDPPEGVEPRRGNARGEPGDRE